ncbi:MAG: flagellar hook-associated protein FlgL [Methylophilaceae bacterium]
MRLSTNTIYQTGINRIGDLQAEQSKLQSQIASGKRILTPSDEPLGASRSIDIANSQAMNAQFTKNRQIASSNLSSLDISLNSITEQLLSDRTILVGAAGTLTANQRSVVAISLTSSLETLIGYANTQDASGNYIYAGYQSKTKPFTATSTGATYNGDSNQQYLQVDPHLQMVANAPGDSIFQASGNDIFSTYSTLISVLNNPSASSAAVSAAVATAISSIQAGTDTISIARSSVGTKMNALESLDSVGSSRDLEYAQALSSLQDLDYAQALSDVSQKQTILEAAQKSFVKITSLSLFDFIR